MKLDDTYRINKVGNCSNGRNEGGWFMRLTDYHPPLPQVHTVGKWDIS